MPYEMILVETRGRVGLVTFNRPQALNALNAQSVTELMDALEGFDNEAAVGAMVVTGSVKAFAAGADIKEMVENNVEQMRTRDHVGSFSRITTIRKPVIAAVNGASVSRHVINKVFMEFP